MGQGSDIEVYCVFVFHFPFVVNTDSRQAAIQGTSLSRDPVTSGQSTARIKGCNN